MTYSPEHLKAWARRQWQYEDAIETGDFSDILAGDCRICESDDGNRLSRVCSDCVLGPEPDWCIHNADREAFRERAYDEGDEGSDGDDTAVGLARAWLAAMRAKARGNGVDA